MLVSTVQAVVKHSAFVRISMVKEQVNEIMHQQGTPRNSP